MSKKVKTFGIVALIIIAIVVLLTVAGNSKPAPAPGTLSSSDVLGTRGTVTSTANRTEGAGDFASLLSTVKTINIDTSILNNIAFRSLRDYPVTLGTDTVGRNNPFAPIGSDQGDPVISATPAKGPTVQTLQPGKVTTTTAEFGAQVTLTDTVPVSVVFEYGTNDTFGNMTTPITLTKNGTALITASNLLPKTNYVVRAIVVRGSQTVNGNTIPFSTQ